MKVFINHEAVELEDLCTLDSVLKIYENQEKVFAVALNGKFISFSSYTEILLQKHDVIDIIIPMQGG